METGKSRQNRGERHKSLSVEEAYELALNRRIGGIMPENLHECSRRTKPRKRGLKVRKNAKHKYLKLPHL